MTGFYTSCYGLSRHTVLSNDSGYFSIHYLPEGEYRFIIFPQTPIYKPYETAVITVAADSVTNIGTIEVQKADFTIHPGDSLVVRNILDFNGLQAISVDSVVKAADSWPYRVVELSIRDLRHGQMLFRKLTSGIGDLPELRKIDVSNTMINTVPQEISKLKYLRELRLNDNNITLLPKEIGYLDSLETLNLSNNFN